MHAAAALEAAVVAISSLIVSAALAQAGGTNGTGFVLEAFCCMLLTAAALAVEAIYGKHLVSVYRQRQSPSPGLAVGALTVPWVCGALTAKCSADNSNYVLPALFLHHSLASSALILGFLVWKANQGASGQPRHHTGAHLAAASPPTGRFFAAALIGSVATAFLAFWPPSLRVKDTTLLLHRARAGAKSAVTLGVFHSTVSLLPNTFTLGEGMVVSQGFQLLATVVFYILHAANPMHHAMALSSYSKKAACIAFGGGAGGAALALLLRPGMHGVAVQARAALAAVALAMLLGSYAVIDHALWLLSFIVEDSGRVEVVAGWAALMAVALPAMHALAHRSNVPNIIVRKGYHVLAVALFLPALLTQPQLLGIALSVALVVLVAVEVARTGGIPGVSAELQQFMGAFVDGRDAGAMYVTHFTLLLGLALPVWLSNAMDDAPPAEVVNRLWPAALAGIIVTGMGDAAASVVGSRVGRVPVAQGSRKTVEGTAAGWAVAMAAWGVLIWVQALPQIGGVGWMALGVATLLSSLLEASTEQLDNLICPLHYFALLCCISVAV